MSHSVRVCYTLLIFILAAVVPCHGLSQWQGPSRNRHYPDTDLVTTWPEDGPPLLWVTEEGLGEGWGSASVGEDGIFVVGTFDGQDNLIAIGPEGKILWKTAYGPCWSGSFPSARCTPTVENGHAYVISGAGHVACINAETGKILWSLDALKKFEGKTRVWGVAESPLLVDDKVIFCPAGDTTTIVALDKTTGNTVWQSDGIHDTTAYASPVLIEHGGKRIIVNVLGEYVVGVDSATGDLLWKYHYFERPHMDHEMAPYINATDPLYKDGQLFITSGYDSTGVMLKIAPDNSKIGLVWEQPVLDCHHGGVVRVGDYIYGANWLSNNDGNWVCLNWNTGEVKYEKHWENKGSIIFAEGHFYCYAESGHVGLVKTTPDGFEPVSSFKVPYGNKQHWAHPTIYKGTLYIRHGDALMAYDIRKP